MFVSEISLDVDADRDGVVEKNNPNKVSRCISGVTMFCLSLSDKQDSEWVNQNLFLINILGNMEVGSKWTWSCPISQL